jgi:hypothetical protein
MDQEILRFPDLNDSGSLENKGKTYLAIMLENSIIAVMID